MAPYPSVAHLSWGFRDTTDGECIGTGTQRNRRSSKLEKKEVQPEVWWDNPAKAYYRMPASCRQAASSSNLTNPGLGETSGNFCQRARDDNPITSKQNKKPKANQKSTQAQNKNDKSSGDGRNKTWHDLEHARLLHKKCEEIMWSTFQILKTD